MNTIIAALAGAGVTFLVNLYRDRRVEDKQAKARQQEKIALLKLIHTEITSNLNVLSNMGKAESKAQYQEDRLEGDKLTGLAWESVKVRVAELLDDEQRFEHLIACYNSLHSLNYHLRLNRFNDLSSHNSRVKVATNNHWLAFNVCLEETGRFRYFADNGMLVSEEMSPDAINERIRKDENPSGCQRPDG